jgi:hypothetical protein
MISPFVRGRPRRRCDHWEREEEGCYRELPSRPSAGRFCNPREREPESLGDHKQRSEEDRLEFPFGATGEQALFASDSLGKPGQLNRHESSLALLGCDLPLWREGSLCLMRSGSISRRSQPLLAMPPRPSCAWQAIPAALHRAHVRALRLSGCRLLSKPLREAFA